MPGTVLKLEDEVENKTHSISTFMEIIRKTDNSRCVYGADSHKYHEEKLNILKGWKIMWEVRNLSENFQIFSLSDIS